MSADVVVSVRIHCGDSAASAALWWCRFLDCNLGNPANSRVSSIDNVLSALESFSNCAARRGRDVPAACA